MSGKTITFGFQPPETQSILRIWAHALCEQAFVYT